MYHFLDDMWLISQLLWTSLSLPVKISQYLSVHLLIQHVYVEGIVCADVGTRTTTVERKSVINES